MLTTCSIRLIRKDEKLFIEQLIRFFAKLEGDVIFLFAEMKVYKFKAPWKLKLKTLFSSQRFLNLDIIGIIRKARFAGKFALSISELWRIFSMNPIPSLAVKLCLYNTNEENISSCRVVNCQDLDPGKIITLTSLWRQTVSKCQNDYFCYLKKKSARSERHLDVIFFFFSLLTQSDEIWRMILGERSRSWLMRFLS